MSLPASELRLVLASASKWRREICAQVGLHVDGQDPLVDEAEIQAATPSALALARARAKADSLAGAGRVVIGCDQVCHLDGVVYGKPRNDEEHGAQLRALRGRTHELVDGISIVTPQSRFDDVVTVRVALRADLSDAEIDAYVASGDARGCAGGYRAEGPGAWLIAGVEGDWFAVIGLPIFHVLTTLRALGWRPGASQHRSAALPPGTFA